MRDVGSGLRLRTLLVVREHPSGDVSIAPLADLSIAAHGPEATCVAELRAYLQARLADAPPETVFRYAFPEGAALVETDVVLERDDLPRRLQIEAPIRVGAAVVPGVRSGGAWITLLPFAHTFFVEDGANVPLAIASEAQRLAGALQLTPWQYLRLLPPVRTELLSIELTLGARAEGGAREGRERERRRWAEEVLRAAATPLHEVDPDPRQPPLVHRADELRRLSALLSSTPRAAVLLTGAPRVGKSALVLAWLREQRGAVPVFATSGAQLASGVSGPAELSERVLSVIKAATELDAVLTFDNLGELLVDRTEAGADPTVPLRRAIEDGRVRVIAELADGRAGADEGRHAGLLGAFTRLRVRPLDPSEAVAALLARGAEETRHDPHAPVLTPGAAQALVDLADRYLVYEAFPGKAMRLAERLRAEARPGARAIEKGDVFEVIADETGIPGFLLQDDRPLALEQVLASFQARVIGQEEALRAVVETIGVIKARLQPAGKPLAALFFAGPTGVGKTEVARALASFLFGAPERGGAGPSGDRLARFDMSEYADFEAADRLIRGTARRGGLLTQRLRDQPFQVVLLDEIEKAHPAVFDLLLQLLGEGRLTDARGHTTYFHNAIVILTSNLGATTSRAPFGFGAAARAPELGRIHEAIARTFRPELVNRIDRVVAFAPLTRDQIAEVAEGAIRRLAARRGLEGARISLVVSPLATARLSDEGYSREYGARALRRHLEERLVTPLARLLAARGEIDGGRLARVTLEDEPPAADGGPPEQELAFGGLRFALHRASAGVRARQEGDVHALAEQRRWMDRAMRLPRVEQLRERIRTLVAELQYGRRAGEARWGERVGRRDDGLAREREELHRLTEALEGAERTVEDLRALEELALGAQLLGQDGATGLSLEGRASFDRFREQLALLLLCQQPRRDEVALLLTDLGDGTGLELWLGGLLRDAERRRWRVTSHVFAGSRGDRASGGRRWGPPQDEAWMLSRLSEAEVPFRSVIALVSGPWAGALLALEAGLHELQGVPPRGEDAALVVTLLAMKAALREADWDAGAATPPAVTETSAARKKAPVRRFDLAAGQLVVLPADARHRAASGSLGQAALDVPPGLYFPHLERTALEHLLTFEEDDDRDRDDAFVGPLDEADA